MTADVGHAVVTDDDDQRRWTLVRIFFEQNLLDLSDNLAHLVELRADERARRSGDVPDVVEAEVVEYGPVPVVALEVVVGQVTADVVVDLIRNNMSKDSFRFIPSNTIRLLLNCSDGKARIFYNIVGKL